MALSELTDESPQRVKGEFSAETRIFITTDLDDVPNRFASASSVHSSFPAGWIVDQASYGPHGPKNESGTNQWRVEITAIPGFAAAPGDFGDVQSDNEQPTWFSVSEVWEQEYIDKNKIVRFPGVQLQYHVRREYEAATFNSTLNQIMSKHGKVSNAGDMPAPGFVQTEWRLTGTQMNPVGLYSVRVVWTYQHAGRDYLGNIINWTQKGQKMYIAEVLTTKQGDTGTVTVFPAGDIFPLPSNIF